MVNIVNVPGKKYDVSQVSPTPFDMKITLDIWTSSMEQAGNNRADT